MPPPVLMQLLSFGALFAAAAVVPGARADLVGLHMTAAAAGQVLPILLLFTF